MDDAVARSLARWPNVPAVYGWLQLDRRGNWRIRSGDATQRYERIANVALRDFIGRNYESDARGCWYFQNGPQRVFVSLAYTPLVVHFEDVALVDQCGRAFGPGEAYVDEEGSVLVVNGRRVALLDDRDLGHFADAGERLPRLAKREIPERFGFIADPAISLR